MELYRLIIVDDEEDLRQGIIRKLDWEACGYTVVGDAENGQSGLELAQATHPDVIITDIKMPFLDGLAMSKKILETAPDTKIIVLSGFDDFDYAKQAITLGTVDYILKPISATELRETLCKLHTQIDEEVKRKRDIEHLREQYQYSLPLLRTQFLCSLLQKRVDNALLQTQGDLYGISMTSPYWEVALLHCEREQGLLLTLPELIPVSLLEQANESLKPRFNCEIFLYGDGVAVLARIQTPSELPTLMDALNNLCKSTRRFLSLQITIGLGSLVTNCTDICYAAQGAQRALEYRVLLGSGRAILIDDVEPSTKSQNALDDEQLQKLLSSVKFGNADEAQTQRLYAMQIVSEFMKLLQLYKLETESISEEISASVSMLTGQAPINLMWKQMRTLCRHISNFVCSGRTDSARQLVQRTCDYIAQHYDDSNLSVERLCELLFVSPSYFSTVFKREHGENFIPYLTRIRMEKAADLLKTTPDKTYIIAEKVGFSEPNYFSYVFKKHFGMSPSKYREALT